MPPKAGIHKSSHYWLALAAAKTGRFKLSPKQPAAECCARRSLGLLVHFACKAKRNESIVSFKEEKYAKLLVKLQGFVGTTTSAKLKREFFEEQYQPWLYASDEVVEAINMLMQLVISSRGAAPNPDAGRKALEEFFSPCVATCFVKQSYLLIPSGTQMCLSNTSANRGFVPTTEPLIAAHLQRLRRCPAYKRHTLP